MKAALLGTMLLAVSAVGEGTFAVSGEVKGPSGKHAIYVALWDAKGFLDKPVQQVRFEPRAPTQFHFDVAPGQWALSAFEDVNENGKLDMGMFGPKEPNGFSRAFTAWRKPKFEDVSFEVKAPVQGATIALK